MTISTTTTAVYTALSSNLPALLSSAGVANFEAYYNYRIENPDKRSCSIFPAELRESEDEASLIILVECNLPKIIDPSKYVDVLEAYLKTLKAITFDFITFQYIMAIVYPGDWGGFGGGSAITIELSFAKPKDSCD